MSKHFDASFKSLADDDPRGLLYLFGGVPLEAEVTIEPLPRELVAPALEVDHVFRVRAGGREWIWHIEVQTHYRSDMPERMRRYAGALHQKYPDLDIECTLVILNEKSAPRQVPSSHEIRRGGFSMRIEYRVVELWKVEAAEVLSVNRTSLLPWVTLMKATREELVTALRQVTTSGEEKLSAQAVILGELRYDKEYIAKLLGRIGDMVWLSEDILRNSNATKDFIEKIERDALAEGRLAEARRMIRLFVSRRFPELGVLPALDQVSDANRLEQILLRIANADTAEEAISALESR